MRMMKSMGRRATKKRHLKERSRLKDLPLAKLQSMLFPTGMPKYFTKFDESPDLIKIFKLLVYRPAVIQNSISYKMDIIKKLNFVFGTEYRHIITYKAANTFTITHGELIDTDDSNPIPPDTSRADLRIIYEGDLILVRVDNNSKDYGLEIDVQVLTCGLFQDTTDDFRQFKLDREHFFKYYRKYMTLVDLGSDTINSEEEAFKHERIGSS